MKIYRLLYNKLLNLARLKFNHINSLNKTAFLYKIMKMKCILDKKILILNPWRLIWNSNSSFLFVNPFNFSKHTYVTCRKFLQLFEIKLSNQKIKLFSSEDLTTTEKLYKWRFHGFSLTSWSLYSRHKPEMASILWPEVWRLETTPITWDFYHVFNSDNFNFFDSYFFLFANFSFESIILLVS